MLSIVMQKTCTQKDVPDSFDVKILDGAAVVHFLPTNSITTFDDYANTVFIPYMYIVKNLESSSK